MTVRGELTKAGIDSDSANVELFKGYLKIVGKTVSSVTTLIKDGSGDILMATGTTVPTDTTTGYAKGCLFIDTDVVTGTTGLYENIGTNTSCVFNAIGSVRKVALTGTASITEVLHEGKICVITGSGAAYTYTLPEATGSGAIYRFIMAEVNTSNTIFKTADTTNCSYYGSVNILDLDAAAQAAYAPGATDDLMTLNGTTTGGAIGDYIEFIDMATDKWMVLGQLQCPTGSNPATPFSGT